MRRILLISLVLLVLVIPHIVSADTLLVYATKTGMVARSVTSESYATIRNGAGNAVYDDTGLTGTQLSAYTSTTNEFTWLSRSALEFNTSTLGTGSTISSAKIGLYFDTGKKEDLGKPSYGIVKFNPHSNGSLSSADYDNFETTWFITPVTWDNIPFGARGNYTLNSDGLASISKTGWTNFYWVDSWDNGNSFGGTWAQNKYSRTQFYYMYGASRDPLLEITYTSAVSPPVASFTINKTFVRIPNFVSVTDTSTNTPTSWSWDWGDGSAASTTQNPTHQYKKRGKFTIVLTATNAGGSDASDPTYVRVVGYENV